MSKLKLNVGQKCSIHKTAFVGFEEHGKGSIFLGDRTRIRPYVVLRTCGGIIKTGENVNIGIYTVIHALGGVYIGNNVLISPNVGIYAQNHGFKKGKTIGSQPQKPGKIVIGNDVWIGANCVIIGPAIIGSGCVIGAGCVIRGNLPPNTIVYQDPSNLKMMERK